MEREIVVFGASVLRDRCAPVTQVGDDTRALVRDLFDTMHAADGVGLAAPQIGQRLRVIAVDVSHQQPQYAPLALVNPEIIDADGTQTGEEGCLSFPGLYADVKRAAQVRVRGLNPDGREVEVTADGFFARALQHELDHLDGTLFVDRMNSLKRQLMRGSLRRLKKQGEAWDRQHQRRR